MKKNLSFLCLLMVGGHALAMTDHQSKLQSKESIAEKYIDYSSDQEGNFKPVVKKQKTVDAPTE